MVHSVEVLVVTEGLVYGVEVLQGVVVVWAVEVLQVVVVVVVVGL